MPSCTPPLSVLIVEDEALLAMDIELNAQGLEVWLDKAGKH